MRHAEPSEYIAMIKGKAHMGYQPLKAATTLLRTVLAEEAEDRPPLDGGFGEILLFIFLACPLLLISLPLANGASSDPRRARRPAKAEGQRTAEVERASARSRRTAGRGCESARP
jgi:hypothetical protein